MDYDCYFSFPISEKNQKKDEKLRYDERTFGATQVLSIVATLFVCLMPFILAVHSELVSKTISDSGDVFIAQNNAIWLIHSNMFRIMLLLFFRLMTIDMTLFQFIDWFLEQLDEDEVEDLEDKLKTLKELESEMANAKPDQKKEIEKKIEELMARKV